jgi:Secretory lipase
LEVNAGVMHRPKRWVALGAAVVIVLIAIPVLWAVGVFDPSREEGAEPSPIHGADLGGTGPGSLLSARTMPGLAKLSAADNMRAARVVYRSTSGDTGSSTVVSGSVFTPAGDAPSGGWPVVAYGHGTTGIDEPCAPSLSDSLLGMADTIAAITGKGFAVAFPDYQGLGTNGVHPYTDARTAGLNLIDAVRALRHTFPNVSDRWVALGGSQGGGAAWSADEQASSYAPELKLLGAVAISPAADVTGLVDKAQAGTLTADQRPALQLVVESLARLHQDLNRDDYRHGAAAKYWDVLSSCSEAKRSERDQAAHALGPIDLAPGTPAAADRLRQSLHRWALPQQRLSAPLYVWYGGADTYIDADWTSAAIRRACDLGGTVAWRYEANKGHGETDLTEEVQWIADRFAGRPVTNDCR